MNKKVLVTVLMVALLGVAVPAFADPGKHKGAGKGKMAGLSYQWKATSPAIHEGDQYTLVATNTGNETQRAWIRTVIMDHRNHTNTDVIDERVELEPGEEREFTTVNNYGDANHFNTLIGSETRDLELAVNVVDSSGTETARFTQGAFLVKEGAGGKGTAKAGNHHDGGFAALVPTALKNTARLAPLSLGVLAVAAIGLYTVRRRRAWTRPVGGLVSPTAPTFVWKTAAVGGLVLSAALHIGLAPLHFEEAAVQGVFFLVAGVVAVIIAAAILAWPSRPAYLAGAVLSLALISLWGIFLLVPPPSAETAEAVELVGLFTKATELVSATACAVLWSRATPTGRVEP